MRSQASTLRLLSVTDEGGNVLGDCMSRLADFFGLSRRKSVDRARRLGELQKGAEEVERLAAKLSTHCEDNPAKALADRMSGRKRRKKSAN